MLTLKDKINRILGNNVRLLLPSYWWKRLFGMVVDRIDEVHPIVDSADALNKLDVPDGSLASIKGGGWFSLSDAYLMTEEEYEKVGDGEISLLSKCTPISSIRVFSNTFETESLAMLATVLISDSKFTYGAYIHIVTNGMIFFSDSEDMYEVPLCLEGQLYEENIRKVNKKISEKECVIAYYEVVSSPISNVDKFVKFSSTPGTDVYIKCGSWERLVKESDINITFDSELSKTSKNAVQNKVITKAINAIDARVDDIEDFLEQGSNLTLTIKSNQSSDATISAVKASIKYENKTVESGSGIIGLPAFATITITFPNIEGYKTPEPITFDTNGHPISYTAIYETELVNINLSAWDGTSVIGQIITINGKSYTWDGNTISQKVPYGTSYWITCNEKQGYFAYSKKFLASQPTRNIEALYAALQGTWITIDQTITDPATMITGQINGEHIQLIRNNSHRYLGKKTAEGEVSICQLDDYDSNYYHDGTPAVLTGSEGWVYMRLPKFFYKSAMRREDVWSIGFYYGDTGPDETWNEYRGDELIGVYKICSNREGKSISGVRPVAYNFNDLESSIKTFAGEGFRAGVTWQQHCIMAMLFYAKYGHTNCVAICGSGSTQWLSLTGATDVLGMEDTIAGVNGDGASINFWGLENWWGDSNEYISNVSVSPDNEPNIMRITERDGTTRDLPIINSSSTVIKMYIGKHVDFIATDVYFYSSNMGYCAYQGVSGSIANRVLLRSDVGTDGNVSYLYSKQRTSYSSDNSSRISFGGKIVFVNDVEQYKSLKNLI